MAQPSGRIFVYPAAFWGSYFKEVTGFDYVLCAHHRAVSGADRLRPADGETADRGDGAYGVRGDHAAGKSGRHSHAGRGDSSVFRAGADFDGSGVGAGAVRADPVQREVPAAAVRQAGDPD